MNELRKPPKPVLTLRVGVTGHRPNKLSPAVRDHLVPQIDALVARFKETLGRVHAANGNAFASDTPVLRVVSPLAEGARQEAGGCSGKVNVNVEPTPGSLSTPMRPPWSSMNFRASASPSPVPSTRFSCAPTWRNSSNTAS